ncbi:MAG TPA: glycoside hydrolase family 25 protein [Solirubrobacterales bacterium]
MGLKFVVLDGCPCPRPLYPILKKLKKETDCEYSSIYRGDDALELLHENDKHSQRELAEATPQQRAEWGVLGTPNPPDRGTHILLGDGVVGRLHEKLPWFKCGIDINLKGSEAEQEAEAKRIERAARRHGWELYRPYPSGSERHHFNFRKKPAKWKAFFRHVFGHTFVKPAVGPAVPVPEPHPEKPRHRGKKHRPVDVLGNAIDVSEAQGDVNWRKVARKGVRKGLFKKRSIKVAIVKATEGRDWTDGRFSGARLKAIAAAGLSCGVYHFGRPDNNSGRAEARHFVGTVKAAGGHFISFEDWREGKAGVCGFLDFETAPYPETFAREFASEFKRLTGVDLGIYGGGYSLNPILKVALRSFACVWLAAYVSDWDPYFDGPNSAVKFWQNSSTWRCPGVSGDVDHSIYLGR